MIAAAPVAAIAQSLSVSPTKLLVGAPGSQAILVIKASGAQLSVVQARVLAWNEKDDPSKLSVTRNVVVSPPAAQLKPGQELTLRIVRVAKTAVRKRECYRVLVDRLPGQEQAGEGIKLQVRHSVPLCFTP
jgi:fimbrial chaperone protein